jgi:hypothetical protein
MRPRSGPRFGETASNCLTSAARPLRLRARERPFSDGPALTRFIGRFFRAARQNLSGQQLALLEAAGWLLLQAWQSGSHFPAFAENYATALLDAVEQKKDDAFFAWLAAALAPREEGLCGLQHLVLHEPELIRDSERHLHAGSFDGFLRAKAKHAEIEQRVAKSADFDQEWQALRRLFPKLTRTRGILHRTLAPERNWIRGDGAAFGSESERFQAALDLLCWKYGLWGIQAGKPLVLKPSVTVTPWGTQIFIPAWQSLDAKRDFDFRYIARLHRARGISRQGEKLSAGRSELQFMAALASATDRAARKQCLRGQNRLNHVRSVLRLPAGMDDREIRRLISRGRM